MYFLFQKMVDIPASYASWSSLSVQQFARDLVVTLALYLATTIAELLQNVLTQKSRGLVDEESPPLLTPKYWMQPISPPKQRTNTTAFQAIVSWLRCRHRMNRWRGKFLRMWLSWWWFHQLALFFKLDLVQEWSVFEEYIIISCQIMAIVWVSIS